MGIGFQVVFDAADPARLAAFWARALGYVEQPPPAGFRSWEDWATEAGIPEKQWGDYAALVDPDGDGPRIFFQRVPEEKAAKNRVHLDINVGGGPGRPLEERRRSIEAHVALLEAEGATRVETFERRGEVWVVMRDPEGNEFCVQ